MILNTQHRDEVNYYLDLAQTVAENSTCVREKSGAVLVSKDDIVVTTGFTGSPRGRISCIELNYCTGDYGKPCRWVHAEANTLVSANRRDTLGGTLYIVRMTVDEDGITNGYLEDTECCEEC